MAGKWSKILTKKFLEEEYVENKKTIKQIANMIGSSITPIRKNLTKYKIKIRTVSEAKTKGKVTVNCAICNKEIKVHPYRIKESKNFSEKIGKAAREKVKTLFSVEKMIKETENIYFSVTLQKNEINKSML